MTPPQQSDPRLRIEIGDQVGFIANAMPQLTDAQARVVRVAFVPAASDSGPLHTTHVVVTVTAIAQGSVTLSYTNCSGTGC